MDFLRKRILAIGIVVFALLLLLPLVWDWSRYWLPTRVETRLFFEDDAWISSPEEDSLAGRIISLRLWKDARAVKKEEQAANALRWQRLAEFEFADEHLSCENTIAGRWFIRFGEDGVIESAVPADHRFAMAYEDPNFPVIDLGEIFRNATTYRRVDVGTMEFSNPSGTWRFGISPILDEVNGILEHSSLDSCCNRITLESLTSPKIRFELWRDESNASKFEFYRKQGNG